MPHSETNPLSIVIVGLGYVGVTAAACLSSQGHRVFGVDVNDQKVVSINEGRAPIEEPEIEDLLSAGVKAGTIAAATALPPLDTVDLVIVCVGTPSAPDGSHNMGYIAESARQIALAVDASSASAITVAFRSTFRPGTMEELIAPIFAAALGADFAERVELVYNPEFLRESTAVQDYFAPPKIVIGTVDAHSSPTMNRLHESIDAPVFETGFREAEITKFVDNSWHAVKVAFANEVGRVCAAYGVDAATAHQIFVSDTKLNISPYYTRPGGAFGGSCLPKDVRAMQYIARSADAHVELLDSLITSNESHKAFQLDRVIARAPEGTRLLIAGLAFKAGTDDMRESPNVTLVAELLKLGYDLRIFDPTVHAASLIGQNLGYVLTAIPALRELLVDTDDLDPAGFDLVVVNNTTGKLLGDAFADVPRLDLHTISA